MPQPFEIADDEWNEILELLNDEADDRGINSADFSAMVQVMKEIWKLLNDRTQRRRQLIHFKHVRLNRAKTRGEANLTTVNDEIARLPRDPGKIDTRGTP